MIEIKKMYFSYGKGIRILKNINLTIGEDKPTFIIGKNGCGKTTLLNILIKELKVEKDTLFIDGKDINEFSYKELSKKIAYVPQLVEKEVDFLVIDYLLLGLVNRIYAFSTPKKEDYQFVINISKEYEVDKYLYKSFNTLSGGERQLISIVRAVVQDSKYILMDEPTSALDIPNQYKVMNLIKKLSTEGKILIITTHNPNHCFNVNCNVILMKAGEIYKCINSDNMFRLNDLEYIYDCPPDVVEKMIGKIYINE